MKNKRRAEPAARLATAGLRDLHWFPVDPPVRPPAALPASSPKEWKNDKNDKNEKKELLQWQWSWEMKNK